jgi:hypothetical protein
MTTVSPDSMVSAGLLAALKLPILTVCGLGISVYSAACKAQTPETPALHATPAQTYSRASAGITDFSSSLAMMDSLISRQA